MIKGFTLVETLLYMGLFAMFILVLSWVFVAILDVQLGSESTSGLEQDGRYVLNRIMYDVHRATSVSIQTNQLQLNIGGVTYSYGLGENNLQLTDGLGVSRLNSFDTKVSGLVVNRVGDTVEISFTVTSLDVPESGKPLIKTFQTTVGLR